MMKAKKVMRTLLPQRRLMAMRVESDNTSISYEDLNQSDQLPTEDGNDDDDDVSMESTEDIDELTKNPYEQNIIIDDIDIVTEMNMSQLAAQQ